MNYYNKFLSVIICIKFIFVGLAIYLIYIKRKEPNNKNKINKIENFKKKVEIIFTTFMAVLLIYLFNPRYAKNEVVILDYNTRLLLFLFGFVILITSDWSTFIKNV